MANLIQHDTFEPYYAGRDKDVEGHTRRRTPPKNKGESAPEDEIVLPDDAVTTAEIRRDAGRTRRIVSH